jgi:hypothetical protein
MMQHKPQEQQDTAEELEGYDYAVPIGSSEAAKTAERLQTNEMTDAQARGPSPDERDAAKADRAIAEVWEMMMDAKASAGEEFRHWRADEEEKREIREHVAPEVRALIPNRWLLRAPKIYAAGIIGKHLISKRAQDPNPDE